MTLSLSVLSALPHDRHTAYEKAREHGAAEGSNDVATIMPTVSEWDQHFAMLTETDDGGYSLRLEVDRDGVERFYEDRVSEWLLEGGYGLKSVQMPWYSLTEAIGIIRLTETGELTESHVVVLFPTWPDGIIGEILWEPRSWDPKPDWRVEANVSRRLDEFERGWLRGDVTAMLEQISDDEVCSVMRVAEVSGDRRERVVARSKTELGSAWSSPEYGRIVEATSTNRVVTQFYAFASHRVTLAIAGRRVEREIARLFPVAPDGRFIGELSYAFEIELPQ